MNTRTSSFPWMEQNGRSIIIVTRSGPRNLAVASTSVSNHVQIEIGCGCVGASLVLFSWSNTSSMVCLWLPWPSTCFSTYTAWKQRSRIGQKKFVRKMCNLAFDHKVAKKGNLHCRLLKFIGVISLLSHFPCWGRNLSLCFLFFQIIWKLNCTFPCISGIVSIFNNLLKNVGLWQACG